MVFVAAPPSLSPLLPNALAIAALFTPILVGADPLFSLPVTDAVVVVDGFFCEFGAAILNAGTKRPTTGGGTGIGGTFFGTTSSTGFATSTRLGGDTGLFSIRFRCGADAVFGRFCCGFCCFSSPSSWLVDEADELVEDVDVEEELFEDVLLAVLVVELVEPVELVDVRRCLCGK